jgi:CheY-like chemotaxis protein
MISNLLRPTSSVLDISKITSGTFQVQSTPFDLQDLMARATRMQKAKAGKVKMKFISNPSQPAVAFADPDILVRIIANLISNSLKFTAVGGVQPFVCPLEDIVLDEQDIKDMKRKHYSYLDLCDTGKSELDIKNTNKRLVAVGVADTGNGLSKAKLKSAEMDFSTCDTQSSDVNGVRNSGFGLHLIHLLAKVLGSRLQLSSLEKCRKILNQDMLDALEEREIQRGDDKLRRSDLPGKGSVLFITLPVYEDGENAARALRDWAAMGTPSERCPDVELLESPKSYAFAPRPSNGEESDCFRILVADDVLMLRKGMANALTNIFTGCPVSISTCCTAEDVLRATDNNPFDLIICDNLFHHDVSKWRKMENAQERAKYGRPSLTFDARVSSRKEIREKLSEYFSNERFTLEEGDGEMTGFEAMLTLERTTNPTFPTPVLMILSGQKIEVPSNSGIMVAQKPLNQSEFISLLERSAPKLIQTGYCREEMPSDESADTASLSDSERGDCISEAPSSEMCMQVVVNRHGTQLFVSHRQ